MNYEELPKSMQEDAIRPYWELLQKKRVSLFFKRLLDMIASFVMLVILSPFLFVQWFKMRIRSVLLSQREKTRVSRVLEDLFVGSGWTSFPNC